MNGTAPIGVLIPTLNCASLLPGHLESLNSWVDLAAEVVIVDSASTDGTVAYLKEHMRHPRIRFLQHPRGLYQSWNFGVRNLTTKYAYISTVGDSITRAGLEHLLVVAETNACDVVVSKPRCIDNQDCALSESRWPIDDVLEHFPDWRPLVLEGLGLYLFALANCTAAILGSSASNLYRTACLRQHPFRSDFGTVGDGAWGLSNALDVRVGFTAEIFSTFRDHPKAYAPEEYAVAALNDKLFELARETFAARVIRSPELQADIALLGLEEIMRATGEHLAAQKRLEACRRTKWPWVINPAAWISRVDRSRHGKRLAGLKRTAAVEIRRCGRPDAKAGTSDGAAGP